jgi:RNA-directed DNA polymerase
MEQNVIGQLFSSCRKSGRNTEKERREKDTWGADGRKVFPRRLIRLSAGQIGTGCCSDHSATLLEFDIKGLFDNIDHDLLMKAVRTHTNSPWIILYIERWLKAPFQMSDGSVVQRTAGTPQGGVISPVLANLFLHYAFDKWMDRNAPNNPFARYADDAVIHCRNKREAEELLSKLEQRFRECKLELHPDKTRIVYCKDSNRSGEYPVTKFDFLGYTFRPRLSRSKQGNFFVSFTPAASKSAGQHFRDQIREIRINNKMASLEKLATLMNPVIQGWANYFSKFRASEARRVLDFVNLTLVIWIRRRLKTVRRSTGKAYRALARIAKANPHLFHHWRMGIRPTIG